MNSTENSTVPVASCFSDIIYEWIQKRMSSNLTLDFGNQPQRFEMDSEAGIMSIDQGGEWGKTASLHCTF